MITPVDSKYISSTTTIEDGKTKIKVKVEKTGIPIDTKKVHISYLYIDDKSEDPTPIIPDPVEPEPESVPIISVDFAENPVIGSGLETNEFGIALAGSATPTAADFVTYGGTTEVIPDPNPGENEEPTPEPEPTLSVDFTKNPVIGSGLETNEFGIAIAGSATPTAADFVTYGE